jgi:hypothetical protein
MEPLMCPTGNTRDRLDLTKVSLERIAAALAGIEQYARVTKKDLVRRNLRAIEDARQRGVGYEVIASALTSGGCPINARVLRKYVHQLSREVTPSPALTRPPAPEVPNASTSAHPLSTDAASAASDVATPELIESKGPRPNRRSLRRGALLTPSLTDTEETKDENR